MEIINIKYFQSAFYALAILKHVRINTHKFYAQRPFIHDRVVFTADMVNLPPTFPDLRPSPLCRFVLPSNVQVESLWQIYNLLFIIPTSVYFVISWF